MKQPDGPAPAPHGDASAPDTAPSDAEARPRRGLLFRTPLFDDKSRYLDHFGWLLALTVLTVSLSGLINPGAVKGDLAEQLMDLGAAYIGIVTLLLAFAASGLAHRRLVIMVAILGVLALLQTLTVVFRLSSESPGASPPVGPMLLSVAAFFVIVRRLSRHRRVTRATLLGAVTAYLFIPLSYFYAFRVLDLIGTEPFFGQPQPAPTFMFFSLTTVTTLGYGDPLPVGNLARLLSTSEAVIGQLYLVTVVALIVGLMSAGWHARLRAADGEADA